jgi:uncharacterized protein YkwD
VDPTSVLALHNAARAQYSAAPLVWNANAAAFAANLTSYCPGVVFSDYLTYYDYDYDYYDDYSAYGEITSYGFLSPYTAIASWIAESSLYNFEYPYLDTLNSKFAQVPYVPSRCMRSHK